MPFTQINSSLAQALENKGYKTLTPVQQAVLEQQDPHQDLLVSAQTGSGKTVAYGIAMAPTLLGNKTHFSAASAPQALIIAPTRELALQVHQELTWLYADTNAKIITCIGGMNVRKESFALERGCHIVVGTPGRLCDHVRRRHLDLSDLKVMVLDEADEMLDLGFRDELEELLSACANEHRTLLFSATIDKAIESLAKRYQNNAIRINTVSTAQHIDIEYHAVVTHPKEVDNAVVNLLRYIDSPTAMVFCATRELVRHMQSALIERGFSCAALSGDLGQEERTQAIKSLRTGQVRVCVATDVAARGLDLPTLDLVIHASLPTNHATLLHRSGRTGRAGRKGVCALIVPNSQRNRAEQLLRKAKVAATWETAPSITAIHEKDNERLLNHPSLLNSKEVLGEDQILIDQLTSKFSINDLANTVISLYRTTIPNPEEITPISLENRRSVGSDRERSRDGRGRDRDGRSDSHSFESGSWYEMPVGRSDNADPKWLIPMLCKIANIQKKDIGSIRISDRATKFEIAADKVADFNKSISRIKDDEVQISPSTPAAPSEGRREGGYKGRGGGDRRRDGGGSGRGGYGGGRGRDKERGERGAETGERRERSGGGDRRRSEGERSGKRRPSAAAPSAARGSASSSRKRRK
ncbi:Superfamily II DNA and RNA helicase (SrmB) (PDB:3RRM) [Commensalibacter communis]|uniref:Superfamily II DNA and RNA helicase (SrmB) n=1 Tax=Commensalibacter communis TaxID=2972786 RepID=A0A9W4TQF4_9PROT|nr:DEAD/DEAH box helicase [Commensalibacter communis]CAI3950000.1 Superfamily II DNA and RNA helicase (SrmB) (PDB:3RRM) [Commensalibacter communis]CAI3953067.1 Superfamily II DNA and RNA helicase (SrmB) (PDB:3RRM) [Commensalibacter communis]CAI3954076.1 Superfamily II DNA and RNA helicase (SrmB) (PDB:3RRM) [Commensalibacter communis]CAI3955684.1 Superfamily II DNA and RNA helicase (SrmB) (PDB:3RRM) [Commensalibacter communis]